MEKRKCKGLAFFVFFLKFSQMPESKPYHSTIELFKRYLNLDKGSYSIFVTTAFQRSISNKGFLITFPSWHYDQNQHLNYIFYLFSSPSVFLDFSYLWILVPCQCMHLICVVASNPTFPQNSFILLTFTVSFHLGLPLW